jgi:hypothetical protein
VNNYLSNTDLRNREQKLKDCRAQGSTQCEINVLKEYELQSAKNTGKINYSSVLTEGALAAEKAQLEKFLADPNLGAEAKAQVQRSINELNTAINVIQKAPVLRNAAELVLLAADVATLGEMAAGKVLTAAMVKEYIAAKTGKEISTDAATALKDTMLAEADFASRIPIRADLENHLVNAKVSGREISGGHNMENFESTLQTAGGTVVSKTEVAPGVYEVQYKLPKGMDREPRTKTVYAPSVYSDAQMASMAGDAAAKGIIQYQLTGSSQQEVVVNGIKFFVPIKSTASGPIVPSVFPIK